MDNLTQNELIKKIISVPVVEPDKIDKKMIVEMDTESNERAVSWEEYKLNREEKIYNGNISLHVPKDLHKCLVKNAKEQGVSLNQYCLYKLTQH